MTKKRTRTVIVAADVCGYSLPIVNLAVEIAASADSKLQGLFVEDEDLLLLSGSPLTREISLTTASARPTSTDRLQRTLKSVARQFEDSLRREAQASKIAWSYEYVRGRIRDFGLKPKLEADFTVIGRSGLRRVEPEPRARTRKVLVIADHSAQQLQALSVVLRRFIRDRVEVTLVDDPGHGEFERRLEQLPAELLAHVEVTRIGREEITGLLQKSGAAFDCAILSINEDADDLASVLGALQCPVILVS
ncbi:MAG: hypothetical protein PVI79_17540 [Gammaproteobacteria bacterium]